MPTLAAGSSVTVNVGDGAVVSIASNGGFFSTTSVSNTGNTSTRNYGPVQVRHNIGPFSEGGKVTINSMSAEVIYDGIPPLNLVTYDPITAILTANGSPVSGAGNTKAKPSTILWQSHVEGVNSGYAPGSTYTWAQFLGYNIQPIGAAIAFEFQEAAAVTITKASFTTHSGNPSAIPAADGTQVPILFAGSATITTATNAAPDKIAAPTLVVTDVAALANHGPMTTGRWGALAKATFPNSTYSYWSNDPVFFVPNVQAARGGREFTSLGQGGVDGITTPGSFTTTSGQNVGLIKAVGLQIPTVAIGYTIMTVGDSTQSGQLTLAGINSPTNQAVVSLQNTGQLFTVLNAAFGGASPARYQPRGKAHLAAFAPSIQIYQLCSINTPITSQGLADAAFALMQDSVWDALAKGVVTIVNTGMPHNLGSVSADAFHQALMDKAMAWCANQVGVIGVDDCRLVQDPAAPYKLLAAYDSGLPSPGIHDNDLGASVRAKPLVIAIRKFTGL